MMLRFSTVLQSSLSTHLFEWREDRIDFASFQDSPANSGSVIEAWSYNGADNSPPGLENTRLNLWLMEGKPPSDGKEVEVVVESFRFTPLNQVYLPLVSK